MLEHIEPRAHLAVLLPEQRPWVRLRSNELGRAFLNLLMNAAQVIPEGHPELNRVAVVARDLGGEVVVEITDTGCGLTPEV